MFRHKGNILIYGPSFCGKTFLVKKILDSIDANTFIFVHTPNVGEWESTKVDFWRMDVRSTFNEKELWKAYVSALSGAKLLVIFDDFPVEEFVEDGKLLTALCEDFAVIATVQSLGRYKVIAPLMEERYNVYFRSDGYNITASFESLDQKFKSSVFNGLTGRNFMITGCDPIWSNAAIL